MADVVGVTLVKLFTYRADAGEEYSNQYWLKGGLPGTSAEWKTLADQLATSEKQCYPSDVKIVRAYGYSSDDPDAASTWSYDYAAAAEQISGTLNSVGAFRQAGDAAVWIRWKTDRLSVKGKPIYLRKYFHPAFAVGTAADTADDVLPGQRTALQAHADMLLNSSAPLNRGLRSQSHYENTVSASTSAYITTRTLKRRGKRPSS